MKKYGIFFIWYFLFAIVSFAQDSLKHQIKLKHNLSVNVGLSYSKMFGSMIDRQTRFHDDTHRSDPGFMIGILMQSEMSKRLYLEYGLELITKKSEYFIPSHYFPAKASTTFISVPFGLGGKLINRDDIVFQVSSGIRLNLVSSSDDNLKKGVTDTYFYKYTYESYLTSFYLSPQIKIRTQKKASWLFSYRFEKDIGYFFNYYDNVQNKNYDIKFETSAFSIGLVWSL